MPAIKQEAENRTPQQLTSLLYRLTVAFPSWAGGAMALYALVLGGFTAFRVRLR